MTALATIPNYSAELEQAGDPGRYVLEACERAKTWLAHALEHGDIDQIVELKSQAEAIRIYTMSKQLGKDAELSAAEIIRRAERGIGLAIRKGQAAGEIARMGEAGGRPRKNYMRDGREVSAGNSVRDSNSLSPKQFFSSGTDITQTYAVTDGVSDDQFDAAITEAKAEGDLSRANVVRKVRAKREAHEAMTAALAPDPDPPAATEESAPAPSKADDDWIPPLGDSSQRAAKQRRRLICGLAVRGYASTQIGERLGLLDTTVRKIAREHGIRIPADEALGRGTRKKIDSNRIVRETVSMLEGLDMGLQLVNFDDLDPAEIENWTASLAESIRVLNRLNKRLKEKAQ